MNKMHNKMHIMVSGESQGNSYNLMLFSKQLGNIITFLMVSDKAYSDKI